MTDVGFRFMLLGTKATDAGHILENTVYLELLRRNYDIYVGKVDEYEVDFVAHFGSEILYFQVALTVRDPQTLERELRPLKAIADHYPKFLLTMDENPEIHHDGIRQLNARNWLLGE